MAEYNWEDLTREERDQVTVDWDGMEVPYQRILDYAAQQNTAPEVIENMGTPTGKFMARVAYTLPGRGFLRATQGFEDVAYTGLELAAKAGLAPKGTLENIQATRAKQDAFDDFITRGGQTEEIFGKVGARVFDNAIRSTAKFAIPGGVGLKGTKALGAIYGMVGAESANDAHNQALAAGASDSEALLYAGQRAAIDMGTTFLMGRFAAKAGFSTLEEGLSPGLRAAARRVLDKNGVGDDLAQAVKSVAGGAVSESFEEYTQDGLGQLVEIGNGYRDEYNWQQSLEAGLTGLVAAGTTQGVATMAEHYGPLATKLESLQPQLENAVVGVTAAEAYVPQASSEQMQAVLNTTGFQDLKQMLSRPIEKLGLAAVKLADGEIVTGANHGEALLNAGLDADVSPAGAVSGWVTSTGRFVDRAEAETVAARAKQTREAKSQRGVLHSDDLIKNAEQAEAFREEIKRHAEELQRDADMTSEVAAKPGQPVSLLGVPEPQNAREAVALSSGVMTARTYEELQDAANRYGQEGYYSPGRTSQAQVNAEARKLGLHTKENSTRIAEEVIADPNTLDPIKQEALKIRAATVDEEIGRLHGSLGQMETAGQIANVLAEIDQLQNEGTRLVNAMQLGGTPAAQLLALRRTAQSAQDGPVGILASAVAAKKAPLAAEEKAEFTKDAVELQNHSKAVQAVEEAAYEQQALKGLQDANEIHAHEDLVSLYSRAVELLKGGCDL